MYTISHIIQVHVHVHIHVQVIYMYVYILCVYGVFVSGLPWGVVSGLPRSLQTLVAQLGVDRKNLSINDTITRGRYMYIYMYMYVYRPFSGGECPPQSPYKKPSMLVIASLRYKVTLKVVYCLEWFRY